MRRFLLCLCVLQGLLEQAELAVGALLKLLAPTLGEASTVLYAKPNEQRETPVGHVDDLLGCLHRAIVHGEEAELGEQSQSMRANRGLEKLSSASS